MYLAKQIRGPHPLVKCLDSVPGSALDSSYLPIQTLENGSHGSMSQWVPDTQVGELDYVLGSQVQP